MIANFQSAAGAVENGFAKFNSNAEHCCIELEQGKWQTISVKCPDGNRITFGFVPRPDGDKGHQCVDIMSHDGPKNQNGIPLQTAAFHGQGPTVATTNPKDDPPTTLISVCLPKQD